jgi:serine/threonine-protein kinase
METGEPESEGTPTTLGKVKDLGKYRVVAELARGGMGVVYLALVRGPSRFSKVFVLKVLKPELAEQQSFVTMFLDEARLAARLNHPNVVQTLEVGTTDGRPFLAMEYLEGQSLHRIVRRAQRSGTPLPLAFHLTILAATLAGLHHAHELRDYDGAGLEVVHRDVSPHNVLVTYDGQVKVVDFGIAKAADSSSETRTGVLKGKVSYMAPEQTRGDAVDRRADLFAVGVMLWEAVTGRRLWLGKSDVAVLHERLTVPVPRPSAVKPGVPPALERLVMRAMASSPGDRHPTADAMRAELESFMRGAGMALTPFAELGAFVSQTFAEARALTQSLVEAQLRALQRAGSGEHASLDLVALPPAAGRGTPSGPLSRVSGTMSLAWREDSQVATIHATADEIAAAGRRAKRHPVAWTAAILVAAAAAAGAIASVTSGKRGTAAEASADPPPTVDTAHAPAPPMLRAPRPELVRIAIETTPRDACVYLDDARLAENPAHLARDDRPHTLRVEAQGFAPHTTTLRADADATLRITLERPARYYASARATAPVRADGHDTAPPPSPAAASPGEASRKPQREIETVNPYAAEP